MKDSYCFYDPKHGGCLRVMNKVEKDTYIINGAYGSDEGGKGYWAAIATKVKKENYMPRACMPRAALKSVAHCKNKPFNLLVNFQYKKKIKHVQVYHAYWNGREIKWEDGNTWLQLYA